jgi:hypothetical protein
MEKSAVENLLSTYNRWANLSYLAAVLGFLGGTVIAMVSDKDFPRNKAKMAGSLLFGLIALAGLFGEYECEKHVALASESLRQLADAEAARANAEAARATAEATNAREQAASALRRAANADERASQSQADADRLTKAAALEQLARLQFEAITAARRIFPDLSAEMATELKVYPRQHARIFFHEEDMETSQLAADTARMLTQAHWLPTIPEPTATIISLGPPSQFMARRGIWVFYSTDIKSFRAGQALTRQLAKAGFEVHSQLASPLDADRDVPWVSISIEPRPTGAQGKIGVSELSKTAKDGLFRRSVH